MNPNRDTADDTQSNAPASAQGTTPVESRPETQGQGDEAREAFLYMMSNWYTEFVKTNPNAQPLFPPPVPQAVPIAPQQTEVLRLSKPPVEKIQKYRAEEFRANVNDDPERAEFWLENTIRVLDELSCTLEESLKCVISLLRDSTYNWWKNLVSVVPKEKVTWDFFQEKFRKKYVSQRFIDQKRKEFLELKQGRMTVAEYEREFVKLSKYAQECVSNEATLYKRFEDGLNEDIQLLVGILEIKELVVLVERAIKVEELSKEKRKVESEAIDARKRSMGKSFQSQAKKSREMNTQSNASSVNFQRDRGKQY
ncbi:uncharacterized protein LOC105781616 [Gossypium raimondii]|uniref:uncharacterized protein LOC105781616 n=1 Tax=Gossypium raimondii TaxID=29730 RepID=UPI00227BD076|nr:uncharacterized protein LOC105781616 [Gossypium raimondii]